MNLRCSFLIVCLVSLLVACQAPRQAATVLQVSPKSEIKFEHTITVPGSREERTIDVPLDFDSLRLELDNAYVELERISGTKDSIRIKTTVVREPVYLTDTIAIEFETFTIRTPGIDSVFTIIGTDTSFAHAYRNEFKLKAVSALEEVASGGGSPLYLVYMAILALLVWWAKKKK